MSQLNHLQHKDPEVSVVIPAFNEERYISRTLLALAQNSPQIPTEVIVVDNASTDNTGKIAEAFGAKVIREDTKGVSYARQTGLDATKGKIVLWTDADSTVGENWIQAHTQSFENNLLIAQSGNIRFDEMMHWSFTTYLSLSARIKRIIGYQNIPQPCTGGANMSFRKDVVTSIGGFEPGSDLGEDQILFGKLKSYGEVVINPNPEIEILTSGRRWANSDRTFAHVYNTLRRFNRIGIMGGLKQLEQVAGGNTFEDFR